MAGSLRGWGGDLAAGADTIEFDFEGQRFVGRRGETLAAALAAAGIQQLRLTQREEPRGIFCGMGVCQECLVEVDGIANQRACMTKLESSLTVRRQRHLADAVARREHDASANAGAEILDPDILVVGGGIGGLNAALSAARAGARVLLVDERPLAGGQYYKQPLPIPALMSEHAADPQFASGRALIASVVAAGVTMLCGAQVWGAFEPLELLIFDGTATRLCRPKRLIVAAGAYERGVPIPGWTLPGVMTTGAAQTLLRSYRVLAGARVLVAGNGPLNLQVALELRRAGAEIAAVVELARRPGLWALPAFCRMLTSTPALALRGAGYLTELRRRRIPILYGSVLAAVERGNSGLLALVRRRPGVSKNEEWRFEADAVTMGYGFMPSNEILRALGCAHRFDASRGHLVTERDADGRTSVATIYAVGDCAELGGAAAAESEGVIAGLAAACSLNLTARAAEREADARARSALLRRRRFQAGLWQLYRAPRLATELATPETFICRCEEVTLSKIAAELDGGCSSVAALKRCTRSGMGGCQGRYCEPVLAALTAGRQAGTADESNYWAPRPPVRPIRIGDILGNDRGATPHG